MSLEWFALFFSVLAGAIGYYARHLIEKKKDLLNEVAKERRVVYQKFIDIMVDDIQLQGKHSEENLEEINARMIDYFKKYMLYASPDVINAFGDYRQYSFKVIFKHETLNLTLYYEKLSKVVFEMRDDLGLSNKHLGAYGEKSFKGMLINYHDMFAT